MPSRPSRRYFDSSTILRLVENRPEAPAIAALVQETAAGRWTLVVSAVAMLEVSRERNKPVDPAKHARIISFFRRLDAALRAILLNPGSSTLRQLRKALAGVEVTASTQELAQWFRSHLGAPITALPVPARQATRVEPSSTPDDADHRPIRTDDGGTAGAVAPSEASESGAFAGGRRAMLPVFESLHRAVNRRWPDTEWRFLQSYVAAETSGQTFLWVHGRIGGLLLGLPLPPEHEDARLAAMAAEVKRHRRGHEVRVEGDADSEAGEIVWEGRA